MCKTSCITFGAKNLNKKEIQGQLVIDVGSYDVNGSLRPIIESWEPAKYVGIDIEKGPGVDIICNAEDIVRKFGKESFDVVILYEAIYYLQYPEKFVDEARRILRSKGLLLICSANKDWSDFNPSPYGIGYFSVPELYSLIETRGFMVVMLADSPVSNSGLRDKLISLIKRTAVRFHLIPGTLSGREKLKRLFFGELKTLPSEITDGMAEYTPPLPISPDIPNKDYKVIYAVGHVR